MTSYHDRIMFPLGNWVRHREVRLPAQSTLDGGYEGTSQIQCMLLMFARHLLAMSPARLTQPIGCHNMATNQLLHDGGSHGVP